MRRLPPVKGNVVPVEQHDPRATLENTGDRHPRRPRLCFAVGPLPIRWEAEHVHCLEGREFTDVQRHGPFARWRHRHRFLDPVGEGVEGGAMLRDEIDAAALPETRGVR